jgi:hypothetical protein
MQYGCICEIAVLFAKWTLGKLHHANGGFFLYQVCARRLASLNRDVTGDRRNAMRSAGHGLARQVTKNDHNQNPCLHNRSCFPLITCAGCEVMTDGETIALRVAMIGGQRYAACLKILSKANVQDIFLRS